MKIKNIYDFMPGEKIFNLEELKAFLEYVAGRPADNDFLKRIDRDVNNAKKNRKWRADYMNSHLYLQDAEVLATRRERERNQKIINEITARAEEEAARAEEEAARAETERQGKLAAEAEVARLRALLLQYTSQ